MFYNELAIHLLEQIHCLMILIDTKLSGLINAFIRLSLIFFFQKLFYKALIMISREYLISNLTSIVIFHPVLKSTTTDYYIRLFFDYS